MEQIELWLVYVDMPAAPRSYLLRADFQATPWAGKGDELVIQRLHVGPFSRHAESREPPWPRRPSEPDPRPCLTPETQSNPCTAQR